ncbi:MAG: DUF2924 domain-containing protein [Planctomycetes bacterium]|nr:DUF2924 domain-containing protein [Planctomycetota bacterium]
MKAIQAELIRLQSLPKAKLIDLYKIKFGKVPRITHREFLWKRVAWKIQEDKFGGLSRPAQKTLEALIAEIELPAAEDTRTVTGKLKRPHQPGLPSVGTVLTREWHDQNIRVEVLENGFAWNGETYRSLTAVAKAVTGTHWNGKLFFGLTKRSRS